MIHGCLTSLFENQTKKRKIAKEEKENSELERAKQPCKVRRKKQLEYNGQSAWDIYIYRDEKMRSGVIGFRLWCKYG